MGLPDITKAKVTRSLEAFCDRRVPPHVRDEVRLGFRFRGNAVTLFETRPQFRNRSEWIELNVAQFRFNASTKRWHLYCCDRNSKWHRFDQEAPATIDFDRLLAAVDADTTGIFWG